MCDFSWKCFTVTGSIDAYLLYKDAITYTDSSDKGGQRESEAKVEG
nr:YqzL family protein [Desmospora activa]